MTVHQLIQILSIHDQASEVAVKLPKRRGGAKVVAVTLHERPSKQPIILHVKNQ